MRYIADSNNYLLEVSFGADIMCNDKTCTEYTGAVPSGYSSLVDWFCQEGDKLYRWKIVSGQLTLDSSVAVKADPGAMFAPGGYGYGEGLVGIGNANDDATFTAALSELFTKTSNRTRQFYFTYGGSAFIGTLWNAGNNYGTLIANSYAEPNVAYRFKQMVRVCTNGTWGAWVDNSPANNIGMKLLWTNASPTSSFNSQTISLDLSSYQAVLIYFNTYAGSATYSGHYSSTIAKVGQTGVQSDNGETGAHMANRAFVVNTTGIEFKLAYYASAYGGSTNWSSNCLVPCQIYGIKGVG